MESVSILGVGSYAMALAHLLGHKGYNVLMWSHSETIAESINQTKRNPEFLKDIVLSESVRSTISLQEAIRGCKYLISLLPTQFIRSTLTKIASDIADETIIINGAKGIENDTLLTISEIFEEIFPKRLYNQSAFISGPSFALEVAQKKLTVIALASSDKQIADRVKNLLSTNYFKVFTTDDVIGIELCGSLKNIIAIGAGIGDGLKMGSNAQAALITGGLREIRRIGIKKGANLSTFLGLAGLGDLVLTCTGDLSRNRFVGREIGLGRKLPDILSEMNMVAEGIKTTRSAYELAKKLDVNVPIMNEIYYILYENKPPKKALEDLMSRDLQLE